MIDVFASDTFLLHETGSHPESAARLEAVLKQLRALTPQNWQWQDAKPRPVAEAIEKIHAADYRRQVHEYAQQGGGRIEADTVMSARSFQVAELAVAAATAAVDRVVTGPSNQALCLIRPPGHHALPTKAMGFCLFNNVAIAARYAQVAHQLQRILIVDWDVHHGNGTQDIFYEDAHVHFFSAHRSPFYPGTGAADETGSGDGLGTVFNLPVTYGTKRREYLRRFESMLSDAAQKCRPELILLSAGFDAHAADPIGSLGLETEDFGELTTMVAQTAKEYCQGRLVSLLEGGYNPQKLADSVQLHLETLVAQQT